MIGGKAIYEPAAIKSTSPQAQHKNISHRRHSLPSCEGFRELTAYSLTGLSRGKRAALAGMYVTRRSPSAPFAI